MTMLSATVSGTVSATVSATGSAFDSTGLLEMGDTLSSSTGLPRRTLTTLSGGEESGLLGTSSDMVNWECCLVWLR